MKKWIPTVILLICFVILLFKIDEVTSYAATLVSTKPTVTIDKPNEYSYNNDYLYLQKSIDFVPYSKHDLLNILYSIFDNGYETFTFYCPSEYTDCLKDIEDITKNQVVITDIGNYVHPFNNFTNLKVETSSLGEIDVVVTKTYSDAMIESINKKLDEIIASNITEDMDINDKILKMHDYIIDNVYYDMDDNANSGNAYGALIEGKAKCAGYADSMALILARLGVKNYKVASEKHVWNAIYLNDEWSQIDLTWDDPIVQDGANVTDTIRHKFYRIDTDTLLSYDTEEHNFDMNIYIELR